MVLKIETAGTSVNSTSFPVDCTRYPLVEFYISRAPALAKKGTGANFAAFAIIRACPYLALSWMSLRPTKCDEKLTDMRLSGALGFGL